MELEKLLPLFFHTLHSIGLHSCLQQKTYTFWHTSKNWKQFKITFVVGYVLGLLVVLGKCLNTKYP